VSRKKESFILKKGTPVTMKELIQEGQNIFRQSNYLVDSIFEQPFKELELKVLCLISKYVNENKFFLEYQGDFLEKINQTMGGFMKIEINKKEFCQFLHIQESNFYQHMKVLTKDLLKKSILIDSQETNFYKKLKHTPKKSFIGMTLFFGIACNNGRAIFYINPLLQIYLQHLKSNFTTLSLQHIANMNSVHAIKIYKMLKQYESVGKRTFQLDELKKILCISHLYSNSFTELRKNVLEIAEKNINNLSDIKIEFNTHKQGKKVDSIEFKIIPKKNHFQQAIILFTKQMDIYFTRNVIFGLEEKHNLLCHHWKNSQKSIEKNQSLFEEWVRNTTIAYDTQSVSALKVKQIKESGTPLWYWDFLEKL
jgi:plasmid replication initiation protein